MASIRGSTSRIVTGGSSALSGPTGELTSRQRSRAFHPLFLVYVAIFALSAVAFFLNLRGTDVSGLPAHLSARFPQWLFIGLTLVISTALTVLWVGRIIPYTFAGRFPDDQAGMTTLVSQAFDLGMLVPLLLSTAILLWRHSAWGYLLTGISMTVGFMMCITIPAFIAVPLIRPIRPAISR